jgi:hypothetical protein
MITSNGCRAEYFVKLMLEKMELVGIIAIHISKKSMNYPAAELRGILLIKNQV